jgi:hypothetical protein
MASNARIGYKNLLENGTVWALNENIDYPVANAFDWRTSDYYRPQIPGTVVIELTLPVADSADYFAFYGQDLYANGGTIKLQYWNGTAFVDCFAAVTPTDNTPRLITFTSRTSTRWRVAITCTSVFSIAVISFGAMLSLEQGMYMGWTPPPFGRATQIIDSVSDGGAFLGRSIVSRGVRTGIVVSQASDIWMRTNWLAFIRHAELKPFFFVPNIVTQPLECVFAMTDGDIPAPAHSGYGFMSVSIPIRGMVD